MFHVKHLKGRVKQMPSIKWRTQDIVKLTNTVRQFNAAITREIKRNANFAAVAPERLSTADLKSMIQTRQDFNRLMNKYQRFYKDKSSRQIVTNTHGVQTSRWQRKETSIDLRIVNAKRAKARKKASAEKGTLNAKRGMNKNKRVVDFESIHSTKSWNKIVKSIENESLSRYDYDEKVLYFGNYVAAILAQLDNPELAKTIMKKNANAMIDAYYDNPFLQIDYIYSEEQRQDREETIKTELDDVQDAKSVDENIDLIKDWLSTHRPDDEDDVSKWDTWNLLADFLENEYGVYL